MLGLFNLPRNGGRQPGLKKMVFRRSTDGMNPGFDKCNGGLDENIEKEHQSDPDAGK